MYSGVPAPASVDSAVSLVERPKSSSTGRPSAVTRTFDGLTSRWTQPAACNRRERLGERPDGLPQPVLAIDGRARPARARRGHRDGARRRQRPDGRGHRLDVLAADPAVQIDAVDELHREEPLRALGDEPRRGARGSGGARRRWPCRNSRLKRESESGLTRGSSLSATGEGVHLVERLVDEAHALTCPRKRTRRKRAVPRNATAPNCMDDFYRGGPGP